MTLKIRIIPSVLFMNGIAVKSKKFCDHRNVGSYINAIRVYKLRDVDELIFLDISATNENRSILPYVVKEIAEECTMPLTVGGGIKNTDEIKKIFNASADKIALNTIAIKNPSIISEAVDLFGSANILVSMDVKKYDDEYIVFSNGGKTNTHLGAIDWAMKVCDLGAGEILLTSIDRDGMMNGYDTELIKKIADNVTIPIIASGGAGKPEDFVNAVLKGGASGLSAASIFHFTQYTPRNIKEHMEKEGIPVRLN